MQDAVFHTDVISVSGDRKSGKTPNIPLLYCHKVLGNTYW